MLPYGRQTIEEEDIEAVVAVLRSDWLTTGPAVPAFESTFAAAVDAGHAIALSNGTAALHAAMFAAGVGEGDEVIVPAMTFVASANCVRYQGATVVFADVSPDTLNVDPDRVAAAVTPRTRAIVTVDYAGQPSDLDELREIADRHNLVLVEDASHALGARYRGRRVGSIADLTTFSLHPVKLITSGEGGVVTTNDPELARRLRLFRNHGITSDHRQREVSGTAYYEMTDLGYNYRLTDFQSALGQSQLSRLAASVARRTEIANLYDAGFRQIPAITPLRRVEDRQSGWHLYVVELDFARLRVGRDEILSALRAENIGVNVHYVPVPWQPYYQALGHTVGDRPVAEGAYQRILSLPIFPAMSDQDVEDVLAACEKVVRAYHS